ncbi:MAG TPA: CxxxxCH/CxxCH domain-containing protein, partial [Acidimicrobiales bacterium]
PAADITGVGVRVNLGAPTALVKNVKYGAATTSGVWDGTLTLAAGTYTIDAQATSSAGTVNSNSLSVTVSATKGDGNLLVRDNAAQLCTDCHSLPTHSSEATGSTYGSWSTSCRDCHTPHATHNVFLVGETITPPPRGASSTTPKAVAFSNTSGTPGNTAARTTATYVNTDNTGPCQVCHTLTLYYRADGSSPGGAGHQTGNRCTDCHQHQSGMAVNCTGCHGLAGRTGAVAGTDPKLPAAPPRDTTGTTVTTARGVGAHQAHLNQNTLRTNPLACADCHPANNAHQGTRDLAWSPLANGTTANVVLTPNFNGTTCASTWCHSAGGTYGGSIPSPAWTAGPSQAACGTCHGAPPPAPHPANPNCNSCHAGYATTGLNTTAKVTHIDGVIQVPAAGSCTACHGTAGRTPVAGLAGTDPNIAVAPPMDTTGSTAADAHMAHINKQSAPVQCLDCHGTLPAPGDPSHPNGTHDVTFAASALANQNGGFATYVAGTCNSTYCHGATLPATAKGSNTAPIWTDVVGCGSCHGAPPGDAIHSAAGAVTTCYRCHNQTVNSSGGIVVNAGLHVNGTVETNVNQNGCEACHGQANRLNANGSAATFFEAAPPTSTTGAASGVAVGVHQVHVNGTRSKNVECQECHLGSTAFEPFSPNPASMWLHADDVVDLAFGPLASQGGALPSYVLGSGAGCAATYCHGNFNGGVGAANVTPNWTASGTLGCTACHGAPPALPHPQVSTCGTCHGTGYSATTVQQVSHIDGTTTGQTFGCSAC